MYNIVNHGSSHKRCRNPKIHFAIFQAVRPIYSVWYNIIIYNICVNGIGVYSYSRKHILLHIDASLIWTIFTNIIIRKCRYHCGPVVVFRGCFMQNIFFNSYDNVKLQLRFMSIINYYSTNYYRVCNNNNNVFFLNTCLTQLNNLICSCLIYWNLNLCLVHSRLCNISVL